MIHKLPAEPGPAVEKEKRNKLEQSGNLASDMDSVPIPGSNDNSDDSPADLLRFPDPPTEINILTLNCWGLRHISKWRRERLAEIGFRIASADPTPSIVALQEVWCEEDYEAIRSATQSVLPYGKRYDAGVFGTGLVILSRWLIEESSLFPFPLNGRPQAFFRGDWFVGKGVACARIRYGPGWGHVIEVFNIHTHAAYEPEADDSYACHRASQAWLFAKLLRGAAERGYLAVGLGDLNAKPHSLPHRIVTSHAPVVDAWQEASLHNAGGIGAGFSPVLSAPLPVGAGAGAEAGQKTATSPPTAEFNLCVNGVTCNSVFNTWYWSKRQQSRLGPTSGGLTGEESGPVMARKRKRHMSLVEVMDLRARQGQLERTAAAAGLGITAGTTTETQPPGENANNAIVFTPWEEDDGMSPDMPDPRAKRIDYIFAGSGDPDLLGGVWAVKGARVGMLERHRVLGCSLSDHFSTEVTLQFRRHPQHHLQGREPAGDATHSHGNNRDVDPNNNHNSDSNVIHNNNNSNSGSDEGLGNAGVARPFLEEEEEEKEEAEEQKGVAEAAGEEKLGSLPTVFPSSKTVGGAASLSSSPKRSSNHYYHRYYAESDGDDAATVMVNNGTYLQVESPATSILESTGNDGDGGDRKSERRRKRQQRRRRITTMTTGGISIPSSNWPLRNSMGPLITTGTAAAATATQLLEHQLLQQHPPASSSASSSSATSVSFSSSPAREYHRLYDEILTLTRQYRQREEKQRRLRAIYFVISLVLWAGALVAATWFVVGRIGGSASNTAAADLLVSSAVAFTVCLIGSLLLVVGTLDGLGVGFLFFASELRSLGEFEWEVGNSKLVVSAAATAAAAAASSGGGGRVLPSREGRSWVD